MRSITRLSQLWITAITAIVVAASLGSAAFASQEAEQHPRSVVFLDEGVEDIGQLAALLPSAANVVRIEQGQDGIRQMADWLAGRQDLDAIHLIAHGRPGEIVVGNSILSADTLASYRSELESIGGALSDTGDLLLYGCDAAQGEDGQAFVAGIAAMTGADVAASDDITSGNAALGDDELEVRVGDIETEALALSGWNGVLPNASKTVGAGQEVALDATDLGYQSYGYIYFDSVPSGAQLGNGSAGNLIGVGFSYPKSTVDGGGIKFRAYTQGTYSFQVTWMGSQGLIGDRRTPNAGPFTITITVVNPAPTNMMLSGGKVPGGIVGAGAGTLSVTDNSGDTASFSIMSDTDQLFEISGSQLRLRADKSLAAGETASVTIVVTDGAGNTYDKTFTIVGEAPTLLEVDPSSSTYLTMTEEVDIGTYRAPEAGRGVLWYVDDSNYYGGNIDLVTAMNDYPLQPGERVLYQAPASAGTDSFRLGNKYYIVQIGTPNTAPTFVGSTATLTVDKDAGAADIRSLLQVSDTDPGQTLTWTVSSAPAHGTLSLSSATAPSGGAAITPGGSITYTPAAGYNGTDSFAVQVSDGTATATRTIVVTVRAPLAQVTGVTLSAAGVASWTDVANVSSYQLQLYKAGTPQGSGVTLPAGTTSFDALAAMRAAGAGSYTVRVTAIGDGAAYTNGAESAASGAQTVIQLGTVNSGLAWSGDTAQWDPVANAVSYDVQLYKNGSASGAVVNVPAASAGGGLDLAAAMASGSGGSYTFRVTAKGSATLLLDGAQSTASPEKIKPYQLTVTGVTAAAKTYDGTAAASFDLTASVLSGIQGGHAVTLVTSSAAGTFADANAGSGKTVTITGLALAGADAARYTLGTVTATAAIAPKPLTITGIMAEDKGYDGSVTASLDTDEAALDGVLSGDAVTLDVSGAMGVFANKNVGAEKNVAVTGLQLAGADAGNYSLNAVTVQADITARSVSAVGIEAADKTYDRSTAATLDVTGAELNGAVSGDFVSLNVTGVSAVFDTASAGTNKPVIVTGLSLSGADAGNYALAAYTTTASVAPKDLTITGLAAAGKIYDGGTDADVTGTAALTGVINPDTVSLAGQATGTFDNARAGTGKTVTIGGLTLVGPTAANYTLGAVTVTADVTPKPLAIDGLTGVDKTYDGTANAALSGTAVPVGVVDSDDVRLTGTAIAVFADRHAGDDKTAGISGLTLAGADAGNYTLNSYEITASILPMVIPATGITAANKTYDGDNTAVLNTSTAALTGLVSGDDVALDASGAVGAFAGEHVGNGVTVTVTGLVLTGEHAGNYTLDAYTTTASILPKRVQLSGLQAGDKVYDGTTSAALTGDAVLNGVLAGDTVTLIGTPAGTFAARNVGTDVAVTVGGLALGGGDATNYTLDAYVREADITPLAIAAAGITIGDKVYDRTTAAVLDTDGAALQGRILGDDVTLDTSGAVGVFDSKDAGDAIVITVSGLTLSGTDAGNYTLAPYASTAAITAKPLTISGLTGVDKGYDGNTFAALSGSAQLNGVIAGDTVTLDGTAVGTFASKHAGTAVPVTVSGLILMGADAGNYMLAPYVTAADIAVKAVTISGVTGVARVYDGTTVAELAGTATLNGIVTGDAVTLSGTATGIFASRNVGEAVPVTVSGWVLSGVDADNYTLASYATAADITPKSLTLGGIDGIDKVYDGTTVAGLAGTAVVNGIVTDDAVALSGTAESAFDGKDVGDSVRIRVTGLTLTGADAGNYTLSDYVTEADITPLTIAAAGITAANKVYDGGTAATLDTTGAVLDGVVSGDQVTLAADQAEGEFASKHIGTNIRVTVNGLTLTGADAGNYALAPYAAAADIAVRAVTVGGIAINDKAYDGTTEAELSGMPVLTGAADGDEVVLAGTAIGTFASQNAGEAVTVALSGLTLTGTDAGNYMLMPYTATADITPRSLQVTGIKAVNRTYNGQTLVELVTSEAALTGVLEGDQVSIETDEAEGRLSDPMPGSNKTVTVSGLTLSGSDAANYTIDPYTVTVHIYQLPIFLSDRPTVAAIEILVNGKLEYAGKASTVKLNDRVITTVTLDEERLQEKIESEGIGAVVTLPIASSPDVVIGELNGQVLKYMTDQEVVIDIRTPNASYKIPARQIGIEALSGGAGAGVSLKDIQVQIEIAVPDAQTVQLVENAAVRGTFTIVAPPLEFRVRGSYGDTTVEVSKFDVYVERTIALPDGIDPSRITTGVVIEPDGTIRHVPTKVIVVDGKHYARINSRTNSTYAVVWHPLEFADIDTHWAKQAVNNMGSRMVVEGTGDGVFNPERSITRAEFAAIIVRGLGLRLENGDSPFSDIRTADWFASAVYTAYEHGLIQGMTDGTFRPHDKITREQAMVIIGQAMMLTKLNEKLPKQSIDATLQSYVDASGVSGWALQGAADSVLAGIVTGRNGNALAAQAHITRAEVAVMVERLLEKSDLI